MLSSCAQHFENVVLWRDLGNVEHRVCIDIGALDPASFALYEESWRDGHVELSSIYAPRRGENGNFNEAAIAWPRTSTTLFEIAEMGLRLRVDREDELRSDMPQRPDVGSSRSKVGSTLVVYSTKRPRPAHYGRAVQGNENHLIVASFFDEDRALNPPTTSRHKAATSLFPD